MTLGEYIYKKRLLNKITAINFAKELDISPTLVHSLENDMVAPSYELLEKIADVFLLSKLEYDNLSTLALQKQKCFTKDMILAKMDNNKKHISAIRVPLGLNLSKTEWQDVVSYFDADVL